jgi:hypothetical protein
MFGGDLVEVCDFVFSEGYISTMLKIANFHFQTMGLQSLPTC